MANKATPITRLTESELRDIVREIVREELARILAPLYTINELRSSRPSLVRLPGAENEATS